MTSAAIAALRVLKANGIGKVFGNPGTTELPLLDGFVSEGMDFILGLNEGVCTSMADGYARATGKVGVVMVHTAVGVANTAMNLINASADRSPLLVIAGDKEHRLYGRDHFCEIPDIGGLVRQTTKKNWRVPTPDKLPELVFRGLQAARTAPAGPVFISVPENLLSGAVCAEALDYARATVTPVPEIGPAAANRLIEAMLGAERPLILAGNGVGAAGARNALGAIASALAVPAVSESGTVNTRLNFPGSHPYYHGAFSPACDVVARADLIVSFGAHLFREYDYPATPWIAKGVKLIQIDADALEINKSHPVTDAIAADAGNAATTVADMLRGMRREMPEEIRRKRETWAARRNEPVGRGAFRELAALPEGRMMLGDLIDGLQRALPADGVLVDESVVSKILLQRRFRFGDNQEYIGTSSGGLGWGVGAALGVQLGLPERPVAALIGDGALLFAVQGLWTAAKYRLPAVLIAINNGGYMAVRRGLGQLGGAANRSQSYPGCWIDDPEVDLLTVAKGFGVEAVRCGEAAEIGAVLQRAFASRRAVLVDARVTSEEFYF